VQQQVEAFKAGEAAAAAKRARAAEELAAALRAQMAAAEERAVLDDVNMSPRERKLNKQLLETGSLLLQASRR
jgi:hypothetical protein